MPRYAYKVYIYSNKSCAYMSITCTLFTNILSHSLYFSLSLVRSLNKYFLSCFILFLFLTTVVEPFIAFIVRILLLPFLFLLLFFTPPFVFVCYIHLFQLFIHFASSFITTRRINTIFKNTQQSRILIILCACVCMCVCVFDSI